MKIALLGSAPSSAGLAPFHDQSWAASRQGMPSPEFQLEPFVDETWEIWGVSPGGFAFAQRATRWFEVHRWEPGQPWFQPAYIQFLRDFRGPVYTGGVIPEIRNHVVYPIERVEAAFSAYFLHSSLSLMLALAILEIEDARKLPRLGDVVRLNSGGPLMRVYEIAPGGSSLHCSWPLSPPNGEQPAHRNWFNPTTVCLEHRDQATTEKDTIGLWGVDMAANEEYGDQRAGCQFFILEAARRGIEIYVPPESCLLRPKPVYGLSEWSHDYIKATTKMREYNQRQAHYAAQKAEAEAQLATLSGAAGDLNYWINTWTNPYGIPAGIKFQIQPGTGLGGGTTHPRPDTAYVQDRLNHSMDGPALVEEVAVEHASATPFQVSGIDLHASSTSIRKKKAARRR